MEKPPGGPPPQQYAQYYRGPGLPGSSERLEALAKGYFGLNWIFLANVVMALTVGIGGRAFMLSRPANDLTGPLVYFAELGLLVVLFAFLPYPYNKQIGIGLGWAPSGAFVASILMGLNSWFCCGMIGYLVMQQLAYGEMKRYGVKPRAFGVRRKDLEQIIAALKAQEAQMSSAPPFPPPGS